MCDFTENKGFTLIELLIVISIIGILSIMSVGAYIGQKEASLLKLGVESVFADISDMRDSVGHGDYGVANRVVAIEQYLAGDSKVVPVDGAVAKCFGFEFTADGVRDFTLDYSGKKVWNPVLNRFDFVGCEDLKERRYGDYVLSPDVRISSLSRNSKPIDKFIIVFEPPFGDVFYDFESTAANVFTSDGNKIPVLQLDSGDDSSVDVKKLDRVSDVIKRADSFKLKSENYSSLANGGDLSALDSLTDNDEVVIKFIYGKMEIDGPARYIKFDIINDEFSME